MMAAPTPPSAIVSAVPTPGEKKALLFLSLVAVLGAGARLVAANQVPVPSEDDVRALEAQLRTVDSVRRGSRAERGRRRTMRAGSGARRSTEQDAGRSTQDAGLVSPPSGGPRTPLDVDRASPAQLESLPGIGPALAGRIAASRDSSGPFGSLEALQSRVSGVGPRLAKRLAPAVTFSGPRSPPSAERTEPFGNGGTPARGKRRRGH
jgi:DNA uptake protein ComE-like DNA-binding protein